MSTFTVANGKLTCAFTGKIDTSRAQELAAELDRRLAADAPGVVVFDLAEVAYISSYFLRLCIKTRKALGEGNFAVVKVKPPVKKIFKVAGLDSLLA